MTKFIKCEQCNVEITGEKCDFAVYTRDVDGKEYAFCCAKCAEKYTKKKESG